MVTDPELAALLSDVRGQREAVEREIEQLDSRRAALADEERALTLVYYRRQGARPLGERDGIIASGWTTMPRVSVVHDALLEALVDPNKLVATPDEIAAILESHGRVEAKSEISTALSYLSKQGNSVIRQAYGQWTTQQKIEERQRRFEAETALES